MSSHSLTLLVLFFAVTFITYRLLVCFSSARWSKAWLLAASLLFYAWWQPRALFILLGSAAFNYWMGIQLGRAPQVSKRPLLTLAIACNLLFLAFFKYAMEIQQHATWMLRSFHPIDILLPIGLSFYTFSQLTYLIDASLGFFCAYSFTDYLLFVSFFPYVTSGPIVKHSEVIPQFQNAPRSDRFAHDLCTGLTLMTIGFFKKTVLGDGISVYVQPIFASAARGTPIHFVEAWLGTISFVLQLYFDFSGYSDIAIGAARIFGIHIPLNFNSPYKATNMIEFWTRWHMTLTRFLTNYVYNPMVLRLVRRRVRQGRSILQRGQSPWAAFAGTIVLPTFITMLLVSLWHRAGLPFIVFGILNGFFLVLNHVWLLQKRTWKWILLIPVWVRKLLAHALTCSAILVGFIFFNVTDLSSVVNFLAGMIGAHGLALPAIYSHRLHFLLHALPTIHIEFVPQFLVPLSGNILWITVLLAIVWLLPNSQQWLHLDVPSDQGPDTPPGRAASARSWEPSVPNALGIGILCSIALWCAMTANRLTEFIYFNF